MQVAVASMFSEPVHLSIYLSIHPSIYLSLSLSLSIYIYRERERDKYSSSSADMMYELLHVCVSSVCVCVRSIYDDTFDAFGLPLCKWINYLERMNMECAGGLEVAFPTFEKVRTL